MSPRRTQPKSLKRLSETRPELRTIVIFTEGEKSEVDYIDGLRELPHVKQDVALSVELSLDHGVPLTLVRLAVAQKRDMEVDECWCIFDVEWPKNHPNLKDAILLAKAHDIRLAISNPCFEVWLMLHYKDFGKPSDTDEVERKSRALDGRQGKSIDASLYMPLRKAAAKRARMLDERHERNGTSFPHDNPSSGMYLFLETLESPADQS
jgi:RloB-like protein